MTETPRVGVRLVGLHAPMCRTSTSTTRRSGSSAPTRARRASGSRSVTSTAVSSPGPPGLHRRSHTPGCGRSTLRAARRRPVQGHGI